MTAKTRAFSKKWIGVAVVTCILFAIGIAWVTYDSKNDISDSRAEIDVNSGKTKQDSPDNQIMNSGSATADTISAARAKEIALGHAGITADKATFIKAELDTDHGTRVYEVEFYNENTEYDYDINAITGDVISVDKDIENYSIPNNNQGAISGNTTVGAISADKAKEIALDHAGITADKATFIKAELDTEHGTQVYEVEFYSERTEYNYEINAATGVIMSYESKMGD